MYARYILVCIKIIFSWIVGSKFSTSLEPLNSGDDDSTVEVEEKEVDEIGTVNISTFLLRTFTTFGFLDLEFVNFSPKLFDSVSKRYRYKAVIGPITFWCGSALKENEEKKNHFKINILLFFAYSSAKTFQR